MSNVNYQNAKTEQALKMEIEELKKKLEDAETINTELGLTFEQSQDQKVVENKISSGRFAYIIRD